MLSLIGNTPLIRLKRLEKHLSLPSHLYAKLESFNPFGSVKDRTALALLRSLNLSPHDTVSEATSGNLGVSLAAIGARMGLSVHLFMPDHTPPERIKLIRYYGAEVHLSPSLLGMQGAINLLTQSMPTLPGARYTDQFRNPANTKAHYDTTGPEIARQLPEKITHFFAGVGTGGTLTGAGRYLKSVFSQLRIIAVEPASSPVLSGGKGASHRLFGIGAGFIPPLLDPSLIDGVASVSEDDALDMCKTLVHTEGIACGPSSGAVLAAACKTCTDPGQNCAVLLPDSMERYLSLLS